MSDRRAIVSTDTGYTLFGRRKVELAIESGALRLTEAGQTRTLTRADCRAIEWIGQGRMRPLVPLPGLVLDGPGGEWIVASTDTSIELADAAEQAAPAPHVWVSTDDLAQMAAACAITTTRREPLPLPAAPNPKVLYAMVGAMIVVGSAITVFVIQNPRYTPTACNEQRAPATELYPRLSCRDARAELDLVEQGKATPRAIVLRPTALTVDARDVTGPATILCDGIEFAVVDAQQADPSGPLVFGEGPHSVLVSEQADGSLRVSQYCMCCNIVRGEKQ